MKNRLLVTTLFTLTAVTIAFYPGVNATVSEPLIAHPSIVKDTRAPQEIIRPKIEVVFVLDTTGSMNGMIEAAKEKVWSIASSLAAAEPAPEIKIGLVAYRDRGDAYITKKVDLTDDLDSVYSQLMQFRAEGGGDSPESVNQALHEAVSELSWSANQNSYQVVFLVGDAPPHMDYQNDVSYEESIRLAQSKGILVNTIQCGDDATTQHSWQTMAQMGGGDYFTVDQNGGALAVSTPFDSKIALLARKLEDTRIFYGSEEKRAQLREKEKVSVELYETSSPAALARRAEFNSSASGAKNLLGDSELVDDVASGKVDVMELDQNLLPEAMRALAPAAQQAMVEEKVVTRNKIKQELDILSQERRTFVEREVAEADSATTSLDYQVFETIQKQAKSKGLEYKDSDLRL